MLKLFSAKVRVMIIKVLLQITDNAEGALGNTL